MSWSPLGWGSSPPPMGGHSATLVGNMLVLFGGNADLQGRKADLSITEVKATLIDAKNTLSSSVFCFDTDKMRWDEAEVSGTPPIPRYSHSAVFLEEHKCIVIFGGAHLAPLADIHVLSLSTLPWQWKQLTWKGPQPAPRYGHTACVYRSVIYVFGGTTKNAFFNELLAISIDFAEGTASARLCTTTGSIPNSRSYHACAMIHDSFMALFGGKGNGNVALNDLFVLDCNTFVWHALTPQGDPPSARFNHGCAAIRGRLFIHGGSTGNEYRDDAVVFDVNAMTWLRPAWTGRLPSARARHSMTAVGERIIVFGGTNSELKLGDLHVLDLMYLRELERVQRHLSYFAGHNLDQLTFPELEELEQVMFSGLKSVSQMKKVKLENQHKQEIAALKKRLGDAVPGSPSAADTSIGSPASELNGEKKLGKKLRFATVEVRTMNRAPGEGVPRSGSAPLGLGWNVMAEEVKPINAYESERRKKEPKLGPVPEDRRQQILLKAGVPHAELEREKVNLAEVLRNRVESLEFLPDGDT